MEQFVAEETSSEDTLIGSATDSGVLKDGSVFELTDVLSCTALCNGKQCGEDQCGGSCGLCGRGESCTLEGLCVLSGELQGFGEECGPSDTCEPESLDWPACLDLQCASTHCRFPVCTQECGFGEDIVNNGDGSAGSDGVEDPKYNSCQGASEGPFGTDFRCVNVAASTGSFLGECVPGTTFSSCKKDVDCSSSEKCGLITISGVPSMRCMGILEGLETGERCENFGGLESLCALPSLCTGDGCTASCTAPEDCLPVGVECVEGFCAGTEDEVCESDVDCSPWTCELLDSSERDDSGLEGLCQPKNCMADKECKDPRYLCDIRLGESIAGNVDWNHVCVLPDAAANLAVGDSCENSLEPAGICPASQLCYKGICSALCRSDRDCSGTSHQVCATAELPLNFDEDPEKEDSLVLRLCETFEFPGRLTLCTVNEDCTGQTQTCAPIELPAFPGLSILYQIQWICREMNPELGGYGESCGLAPGDGECQIGFCGFGESADPVSSMCSKTCARAEDCDPLLVEDTEVPAYCRATVYGWNDTVNPADDLYASTCWPAPEGSSLETCGPKTECTLEEETCIPTFQAADPTQDATLEWLCMKRSLSNGAGRGGLNASCSNPGDCASNRCLEDKGGNGYCSVSCDSDVDCLDAGPTMVCFEYQAIPRSFASSAILQECRKVETCIPCAYHNDCAGNMRCVRVGGPASKETVCVHPCELDADCTQTDGANMCKESETADGLPELTCAPGSCPQ